MHPNDIPHLAAFLILAGLARWQCDAELIATQYVHDLDVLPGYRQALDAEVERMVDGA